VSVGSAVSAEEIRLDSIDSLYYELVFGKKLWRIAPISDHQHSWGYEDGPWKGPEPPLLVTADF
jgi:hypothetical protein